MEEETPRKKGVELDCEVLLPSKDKGPPPELIAEPNNAEARRGPAMAADQQHSDTEYVELRNQELDERIKRVKRSIEAGMTLKLPDRGEKLRLSLRRMEDERERRKRRRVQTVRLEEEADECEKQLPALSFNIWL